MAIDNIPYRDADNLAYPEKRFWPLRIPVSHYQLRHYISHPEPDYLYYASGHEVFSLNTATKKRRLIADLPFDARCTASGYGWVCVGGEEDGHFAAIKLDGSGPRSLEVDAALPIDAWSASRRPPSVKIERIGEQIVNSLSIHRIQDEESHLDDIVAVLTNNDQTVRVYSLPQSLETNVVRLPFAINHATISPDASMMIAVGDYNQAYFFARVIKDSPPLIPKPHNRLTSASIEWVLIGVCDLHVPSPKWTLGYFTTAWSPSGHLVAVASEGGYITVFDVAVINASTSDMIGEEAIVAVIPSSRAHLPIPWVGAVRTMIFSPEPWDLLIWAEDQGRVCIGDLRTGLKTKQVLNLEPKEQGLERVQVEDTDPLADSAPEIDAAQLVRDWPRSMEVLEADFIRRSRTGEDSSTSYAAEYVEARRRHRQRQEGQDNFRQGLTAQEHQILESLRATRQREEARSAGQARSINYTTADLFGGTGQPTTSTTVNPAHNSTRPLNETLTSIQDSLPELARQAARPSSARDAEGYILPPLPVPGDAAGWSSRHANTTTTTTTTTTTSSSSEFASLQSRLPRRRVSAAPSQPTAQTTSSISPSAADPTNLPQHARDGSSGAGTVTDEQQEDDNPWHHTEDALALARGPLFESAARVPAASPLPAPTRQSEAYLAAHAQLTAERAARARTLAAQRDRLRSLRAEGLRTSVARAAAGSGVVAGALPATVTATATSDNTGFVLSMDQMRRVQGLPEGYEALLRPRMASSRDMGVRTTGLAMSRDGGTLWAACEEGIFEFKINRKARMFWPAVDVR